jgi:hypothetical protein
VKENLVRSHVTELRGQADLGAKPKSVQPIRGEVSRAKEQTGENPVSKHVDELKRQKTLKGGPAPLQPIPQEQRAAERLGKPPPLKRNRRSAVIGGRGWGHEWFERLKDIDKG